MRSVSGATIARLAAAFLAALGLTIAGCGASDRAADDTACDPLTLLECDIQTLRLAEPVVGTTFDLVYASDRVPGREATPTWNARGGGLGGWRLSVHHRFDPEDGILFLGDGRTTRVGEGVELRQARADETRPSPLLVASEDASEIYHFAANGRHLRTLDALTGAVRLRFGYDGKGRLATVTDGAGNTTTIERTQGGSVALVAPLGPRTQLRVDANGWLSGVENPAGEKVEFDYTDDGLLLNAVDPNGHTASFSYDGDGRLTDVKDVDGRRLALSRRETSSGYVVTAKSASGTVTTYEVRRDGERIVRRLTGADGGTVEAVNDGRHRTLTLPDKTRIDVALADDPRWRMQAPVPARLEVTTSNGRKSTLSVTRAAKTSARGEPLSLVDLREIVTASGRRLVSVYDASTRTIRVTDSDRDEVAITLDASGRVIAERGGGSAPTSYAYDSRGRVSRIVEGEGGAARSTAIEHEDAEGVVSVTDAAGQRSEYGFDAAGRVSAAELAPGRHVHYSYDSAGNVTAVAPPGRSSHLFRYGAGGAMTGYAVPRIGAAPEELLGLEYDRGGDLQSMVDGDGKRVRLEHDDTGRPTVVEVARGRIRAEYDRKTGRILDVTAPGGVGVRYAYERGLLRDEHWRGAIDARVRRSYDDRSLLEALTIGESDPIAYSYDSDGFMARAGALGLRRDSQSARVTSTALGSIESTYDYDDFGDLERVSTQSRGASLISSEYRRDRVGRIVGLDEHAFGERTRYSYSYDESGRLSEVLRDGEAWHSYAYDVNGNRTRATSPSETVEASHDHRDRLLRSTSTRYSYSQSGRLESATSGRRTTRYEYDELGSLLGVRLPDGRKIDYDVDGFGRRVGKRVDGTLVKGFVYLDDLRPVAELDANGRIVSRFVYGDRSHSPEYVLKGDRAFYLVADHLGSPRLVVDAATGQVAQRIDYDPYGVVVRDTNPGFQPFGFAGGLYDPDTNLVRFGARDYDADAGRWTAPDPILFAGGDTNLYAYALSDPVNFKDPDGLRLRPKTERSRRFWKAFIDFFSEPDGGLTDYTETYPSRDADWNRPVEIRPQPPVSAPAAPRGEDPYAYSPDMDEYGKEGPKWNPPKQSRPIGRPTIRPPNWPPTPRYVKTFYSAIRIRQYARAVGMAGQRMIPVVGVAYGYYEDARTIRNLACIIGGTCEPGGSAVAPASVPMPKELLEQICADYRYHGLRSALMDRRCAEFWGDPHMQTGDRIALDFHAAGEFVAAKADVGDLEVQVRLEPWIGAISGVSAVAARVGGHRIGVYGGRSLQLRVDGASTVLPEGTLRLPGGGDVTANARGYGIRWPDGSELSVRRLGSGFVDLTVALGSSRYGAVSGLLGNFDGDPTDDIATRDGRLVPLKDGAECGDFDALYRVFGESWRVRQAESLFDYERGKRAATFWNRDFPPRCTTPRDLPRNAREIAERQCRSAGVTEAPFLDACIIDVGLTGDPDLARSSAAVQGRQPDHIVSEKIEFKTFDGTEYTLNVVGDYVFTRSSTRNLEVDVRLEVTPSSQGSVLFTGVGALITGTRVSILAGDEPVIYVNGRRVSAARLPLEFPRGGRIESNGTTYRLVWPNGAVLSVTSSESRFERLDLENVPASLRGKLEGLLGDADRDRANDLRTSDGVVIRQPEEPNDAHRARLNDVFASSWRVPGPKSLVAVP